MHYYKLAEPSKLGREVVGMVVDKCTKTLNIHYPAVKYIEKTENKYSAVFQHEVNGAGYAAPDKGLNGTIYVVLPADLFSMAKTVAHECYHIYEGKNNQAVSEVKADEFADTIRKEMLD